MNLSSLSRSTSILSRRVFTPCPSQFVRFRSSSTTYFIPLSSSTVVRLEIAVNSKEVTLKLVQTEPDATGTRVSEVADTTPVPKVSKSSEKESVSVMGTEIAECWVDASPTHIGIVIGSRYKTFALKEGWMTKTRDVNWAETAAIELAVEYLAQHGYTGLARIRSDSATALLALSGGKVKVPEIMESVHRTESVLKSSNLTIKRVKVASKKNIAHRFSRATIVNVGGRKELEGGLTIPDALAPFMEAV
ncbi:hypothetical protein FRC11_012748 [Ceratobasidium sp. 423]|nr:hypothetical protein FRC11_012748 [Ceratobasidium sp. 423]